MSSNAFLEVERISSELVELCRINTETEEKCRKILELLTTMKKIQDKSNFFISYELLKCFRLLLVDIDKKLRVQSCRAIRYVTCNQYILNQIIALNIPIFMMICLEREDKKYYWERLAALKWIRHLIDNYPLSIPKPCVMSLICIASNGKHEYRKICLDSLRELCIINPQIVNKCNGFKVLIDLILNPSLEQTLSNSLLLTILYILDHPNTRKYLRPSLDIQRLLSPFVSVNPYKKNALQKPQIEQRDKIRIIAQKTLITMLKSITGIFYLAQDIKNKSFLKLLVDLMSLPNNIIGIHWARKTMFNVLENALLPLSDSSKLDKLRGPNLIVNYVCLILMAFIKNGLIDCLVNVGMRRDLDLAPRARTLLQRIQFLSAKYLPPKICAKICSIERVMNDAALFMDNELEITVQRNFANMMISELTEDASLDMDNNKKYKYDDQDDDSDDENSIDVSADTICHRLGAEFDLNSTFIRYRYISGLDRDIPSTLMFQGRIPYHSHRNNNNNKNINLNNFNINNNNDTKVFNQFSFKSQRSNILDSLKFDQNASYTENQIIDKLRDTQVIQTKEHQHWDMDKVWKVLNGPLWNINNLWVALNKTRFIKRLIQYLKPSKQFFTLLKWRIKNIRHAQCAVQLFRLLTSCDDGCKNQHFGELIGEIFDCLKDQLESNLKKKKPNKSYAPFSRSSIKLTLSRTYIILIGILSESQRGMKFFQKHHMFPFLFQLTTKEISEIQMKNRIVGPNDYLLRLIATNLDYTVDMNEFPLLFSQWIAKGSYYLRKTLITHLELLYRAQMPKFDEWSINVLTILLKSEQRLALTALKVLEKINLSQNNIKSQQYLIDLIHTHPTDNVIGEYGQFLFIKMLSTVEGLTFLTQSNWLNNKRREWSDKMHTKYTNMLETALVLSVSGDTDMNAYDKKEQEQDEQDNKADDNNDGWLPYHLIYENRSDAEELYAEYLTHFPWSLSIQIITPSGQEITINNDCFFDYNCFFYKNNKASPISLGPGIHAIILDKYGCSKAYKLNKEQDKASKIKISINIGNGCLDDIYNKSSTTKVLSLKDIMICNCCSIIREDQLYCFFNESQHEQGFTRVFWSLKEINENIQNSSLVRPLPHFYGELAKTNEGCTYILSNDEFNIDLQQFILTVHSAYLENISGSGDDEHKYAEDNYMIDSRGGLVDNNSNLQLRSCLWAIGMIGSSKTGLNLLNSLCNNSNDINIIDEICILTKESPTLSIRGTCLYVLGLLSQTQTGMTQLSKYGFGFPADNIECDLAVAIPLDIDDFFMMRGNDDNLYVKSSYTLNTKISCFSPPHLCRPGNMKPLDPNELLGKQGHTEETILAHISSLCNNVTQKSSASALHRLRTKKASVFSNPLLFREVIKLLNTYQFKLAAKRFILFTLFDQVILDDKYNSMDLFDESLDKPLLPFKKIRQWRYSYKQQLIKPTHPNQKNKPVPSPQYIKKLSKKIIHKMPQMKQSVAMPLKRETEDEESVVHIKHMTYNNNNNNNNNNNKHKSTPLPPMPPANIQAKYKKGNTTKGNDQKQMMIQNMANYNYNYNNSNNQRSYVQNKAGDNKFAKPMPPNSNRFVRNKRNSSNEQPPPPPPIQSRQKRSLSNKKNMGNLIQRRISKLEENATKNSNFYDRNNAEYADSITDQMAGPNPLQLDQSTNYETIQ